MTYSARRPQPNMSEFVNQLNSIPSAQDLQNAENFNLDDDLAMFTNTQFFDFDLGQDVQPTEFEGPGDVDTVAPESMDLKSMDFHLQGMLRFSLITFLYIIYKAMHCAVRLYFPSCSSSLVVVLDGSVAIPADDPAAACLWMRGAYWTISRNLHIPNQVVQ